MYGAINHYFLRADTIFPGSKNNLKLKAEINRQHEIKKKK